MEQMTPRARVMMALEHQEPDRLPWDCPLTIGAYTRLRDYLGLRTQEDVRAGGFGLDIRPPLELVRELQMDLYYIGLGKPKNAPYFEAGMETFHDEWGVAYRKVPNPAGYHYEFAVHPLANASVADLDCYPWPDPADPSRVAGLRERCLKLYETTDLALVGKFSNSIFEQAFYMRGLEQWLIDLATNPEFVDALMGRLVDIAVRMIEAGLRECGPYLQVLRLAGDDLGHQRGMFVSGRMFRRLLKPHFARLYRLAKATFARYNPAGKLMAHTDGDVYPIIPDYVEMGLDVLNPVQPYVAEMDHARLKEQFGSRLSFHGGIDIQHVMPFGTPEDVRAEAIKTMRALGRQGGYILAPTHYLQPDVPPENILALRDAVLACGRYPLAA